MCYFFPMHYFVNFHGLRQFQNMKIIASINFDVILQTYSFFLLSYSACNFNSEIVQYRSFENRNK